MNDFTKIELQIMLLDMNTYIQREKILSESPSHKELRDKLELMIDNYCEHEWENRYSGSIIYGIYCNKCSAKLKGG